MARIDTCPNCGHQREIVVILRKKKGQPKTSLRRRWLQQTAPALPQTAIGWLRYILAGKDSVIESNGIEPNFVEWYWRTPFTQRLLREKLDGITPTEVKLIAEALNANDWKYSRSALRKRKRFTDTRAFQIGNILNEAGLRSVDDQNQSHLAPHFLDYLYHVFAEARTSNKEAEA